ncbi:MAG: cell division protein FtsZ [Clostridia bacterium]|nr:cell division protein FtsZ [Clostridia bacterium]
MYGQENLKINTAVIKVMGIGGGGCNAVNSMIDSNVQSAEFYAVNTDNQALMLSKAENCIQIGAVLTKGLGAGSDPNIGEAAAEESKEEIEESLKGTDLLFIAAGMGGGTGTGAASVIARIARDLGILTVAVVTKPFKFEGRIRNENAMKGISNLKKYVDTLVVIPNDKLLQSLPAQTSVLEAFKVADGMLKQGIIGIVDLIATPSLINLDFADVNTVMRNQGLAHMGIGRAKGENRIIEAVRQAVSSPLLETTIEGAKSVILNVTGSKDLTLAEVSEAAELVSGIIDPAANIIFGQTVDETLVDEVKITVIATGFTAGGEEKKTAAKSQAKPVDISEMSDEELAESNIPPLLVEIEKEERKTKVEDDRVFEPVKEEPVREEPVRVAEERAAQEETPVAEEKKGKEIPAFMRKLFGRK